MILLSILLVSCNTQASRERKIKQTVTEFLDAVEKNSTNQCRDLIKDGDNSYGSLHMQVRFLNKNYKKINSYVNLKNSIKVKDTLFLGAKMNYVQYYIKNSKPNYTQKPLIITFMFYKDAGYDKIFNSNFLDNFLDWE